MLQGVVRGDGWRNAAESNINGFDNGDGGLGNARVIHFGVSGDGDDPCCVDGRGGRGRGSSGDGSRRGGNFNVDGIRSDRAAVVSAAGALGAAGPGADLGEKAPTRV